MTSLRRLNPPVHLLRAFSTVVRFGGVSRAAEALHLTQRSHREQARSHKEQYLLPPFGANAN